MSTLLGGKQYATVAGFSSAWLQLELPGCRERQGSSASQVGCVPELAGDRHPCRAGPGDEIPSFGVQITNKCTDHLCTISNIVVNCGRFSPANFMNPKVFRHLDVNPGTCLANDGRSIQAGQVITFTYDEIYRQSMSLKSAAVLCFGR